MRWATILGAIAAAAFAAGDAPAQRADTAGHHADAPGRYGGWHGAGRHETPSVTRPIDRAESRDPSIPPSTATGYDDGYGYAGGTYAPVYPAEPAAPVHHLLPASSVRVVDGAVVTTTSVGAERDDTYAGRSAVARVARPNQRTAPHRRGR